VMEKEIYNGERNLVIQEKTKNSLVTKIVEMETEIMAIKIKIYSDRR